MAKKSNKGAADDIALMASSMTGTDIASWLTTQGITESPAKSAKPEEAQQKAQPVEAIAPIVEDAEETVVQAEPQRAEPKARQKGSSAPAADGKTDKQRERYEAQFFRRIEGFKKPTNMMYMSEKTYRLLGFLLRSSKESNTKITMPEIMENIIAQHIRDNEIVLTQMQQEHLDRISKGF